MKFINIFIVLLACLIIGEEVIAASKPLLKSNRVKKNTNKRMTPLELENAAKSKLAQMEEKERNS